MKKIKVPLHEYNQLKLSGMLVPRNDVKAKVGNDYLIVNPDYVDHIQARCSQNMPIAFVLKEIIKDIDTEIELGNFNSGVQYGKQQLKRASVVKKKENLNKTELSSLQRQPKALI